MLAMNMVICRMKSYLKERSRDYLVARTKHVCLLLESWFRKRTETIRGKSL